MLDFLALNSSTPHPLVWNIVFSICLSFILSSLVAFVYRYTFQGLSYSRNFVQTIILAGIVGCIALQAIGDNLARGLGMMGALSMIRFRASLREPKDLVFIFASLSLGVATGVHSYSLAVAGAIGFSLIAVILYKAPFSSDTFYDGLLRFNLESKSNFKSQIENLLNEHCKIFALISLRESAQGERIDYAYQVKLKTHDSKQALVGALSSVQGAKGVQMLLQESTIEV